MIGEDLLDGPVENDAREGAGGQRGGCPRCRTTCSGEWLLPVPRLCCRRPSARVPLSPASVRLGLTSAVDNAHRSDLSSESLADAAEKARVAIAESPILPDGKSTRRASQRPSMLLHPISPRSSTPKRLLRACIGLEQASRIVVGDSRRCDWEFSEERSTRSIWGISSSQTSAARVVRLELSGSWWPASRRTSAVS